MSAEDLKQAERMEEVGLYTVTTTAMPAAKLLETDDPVPRVRQWLSDVHRAIAAVRAEPGKYTDAVKQNAEECWRAAAGVQIALQDSATAGLVALAIERGAALAEACEHLRVNGSLEKLVRGRERQLEALPNRPTVTDEQIREALRTHDKLKDAAAYLGISERQLRDRRKRL